MRFTPRAKWLRFSLRTLFVVVTVFALWLGWQVKIVRDRRAAYDQIKATPGTTIQVNSNEPTSRHTFAPSSPFALVRESNGAALPWFRKTVLGDTDFLFIYFQRVTPENVELGSYFPEAFIFTRKATAASQK